MSTRPRLWRYALANLAIVAVFTGLLAEIVLRVHNPIYVPLRSDRIDLPVNRTFTQRNTRNPKVDEFQTYSYNSIGLRGPDLPEQPESVTKIVTVGGSTTACVEITDGKTWPDQLFERLRSSNRVWLNNAGQNGHSTFGHLLLLEQHLRKHRPDFIIYLMGINDIGRSDLTSFDAAMIGKDRSLRNRIVAHSELLSTMQVLWRSYRAYDLGVNSWAPVNVEEEPEADMAQADIDREFAAHRQVHLVAYRHRLEELMQRTRDIGSEPILLTQPALFGSGPDPATGVLLDNKKTPRSGLPAYVEWAVLEMYNDVVRDVAAQNHIHLIDLAILLPKDSRYYFDWIHYSNAGAELVGQIVAQDLLANSVLRLED